jgi:hypothetical protein
MPRVTMSMLRELIRTLSYSVSLHAADELADDELTIFDLETIVLSGTIVERQRDGNTREIKYVVRGTILSGQDAEVVVKIGPSGHLHVITIYLD